jgi:ABC-type multidrug transport system ATPase subunit
VTNVVECEGLVKAYGAQRAVDGLNLQVPQGAIYGLLGPNGAGKSTSFGILCGWLTPTAGRSTVLGVPSSELWRVAGRFSALPQDAHFPAQLTLRQQLVQYARSAGMTGQAAQKDADRVLELVGLQEAAKKRSGQLSHGMHKRAGLAQALLGTPEVIFLDEPTSGLDPRTARHIKDLIGSLAGKATVVVSSHNLSEVQEICTHGAILDRGRLLVSGTIASLTRQGAEFSIRCGTLPAAVMKLLTEAFGAENVATPAPLTVRITYSAEKAQDVVTSRALSTLLGAGATVLEVNPGTSLETAFMNLTGSQTPEALSTP